MPVITVFRNINAHKSRAFAVIRDPEFFPYFMRDVKHVKVLERSGNRSVSEWRVDIDGTPVSWIEESAADERLHTITFKTLSGDIDYEGTWKVERTVDDQARITLEATIDWGAPEFERLFGDVFERKARAALRGMLNAVKQRLYPRDRLAFIFHPYRIDELAAPQPAGLRHAESRTRMIERSLRWLSPVRKDRFMAVSAANRAVSAETILVPLIGEQVLHMQSSVVLEKILRAGELARESGARVIGMGGLLSHMGKTAELLSKSCGIPVTSGLAYATAVTLDAALRAAGWMGIKPADAAVAVLGAGKQRGRACACLLANRVGTLLLADAGGEKKARQLEKECRARGAASVKTVGAAEALRESCIAVIAGRSAAHEFSPGDFTPGTVVCDLTAEGGISPGLAREAGILVVTGGLVRYSFMPHPASTEQPPEFLDACLAEAMIIALEGMYDDRFTGSEVTLERVEEMTRLAAEHGFRLETPVAFGVPVTEEQAELLREARARGGERPRAAQPSVVEPLLTP